MTMTLYHVDVTVPAGTQRSSPAVGELEIEEDVITKVAVTFPDGCNGEVYMAVFYGPYQIFPRPDGSALHDSGTRVSGKLYWPIPEKRSMLTVRAWAPEARYPHTLMVDVEALPADLANPVGVFSRLAALLRGWLTQI